MFVGRAVELARVDELVGRVVQGQAGGLLFEGEPGVGKTRLLAEATKICVERGVRIASAACLPLTTVLPFDPVLELLRLLGASIGRRLVAGSPRELFGLVVERLEGATVSGPVVLCVDDLQWSDAATVDLVQYCLARLTDLPLGWLLAARSGHSTSQVAHRLQRDGGVRRLELASLSVDETQRLVEASFRSDRVSASLVRAVHERTGGNPFLCVQLLQAVSDSARPEQGSAADALTAVDVLLPTAVRAAIDERIDGLPEICRAALDWAAVLPEPFTWHELEAVGGAAIGNAPEQLAEAGFVVGDGAGGWRFVHSIVRDAVYSRLPQHERADRHGAVADALADGPLERLAPQLAAARRWTSAANSYLELGRLALNRGQGEDAARLYGRSADLAARAHEQPLGREGHAGRVLALVRSGAAEQARSEARRLRATLRDAGDPEERLWFLTRYAYALFKASWDVDGAREALAEAEPLIARAQGAVLASALTVRSTVLYWAGDVDRAMADAQRAAEIAEATDDNALQAEALNALGRIVGNVRDPAEGTAILELAIRHATAADLVDVIAVARANLGAFAWAATDTSAMETHARAALELEGLSAPANAVHQTNLGFASAAGGDLDRSLAHMLTALRYARRAGPDTEAIVTVSLVYQHLARGELAAARRLLESTRDGLDDVRLADTWGLLLEEEGSPDAALARFQQGAADDRRVADSCLLGVVRTSVAIGELPTARTALTRLERMAEHWPEGRWKSQEAQGWVAAAEGLTDAAVAAFRSAAADCPVAPDATRLRLEAARLAGDRREILAVIDTFETMGARRNADRARAVARNLGLRPGRRRRYEAELTAREQEVRQLVAAGHTNAEIASTLYLSPRTVERHVSSILTKLNCRSRVQVAAQAAIGQLPTPPH